MKLPDIVAREKTRQRRRVVLRTGIAIAIVVTAALVFWLTRPRPIGTAARFRTAPVVHGDIVREVRATGRVDAVATVSVGAEISGRIQFVDVDYNDRVKAGQVLARFDRSSLDAQRAQSAAMVLASKAQLTQARFDWEQARRNAARAEQLHAQQVVSDTEKEAATTALALARARVEAAEAAFAAQEASASVARTNLSHAEIRSPIDGVVITRNIDPGQTVASMLQTPVLFTVAADLRKMEVVAAIDEADIAEVVVGQPAPFTVTAYEKRTFAGTVVEVRNAARVLQDVVTYSAVIAVDNLDFALKPSMTASVRIRVGEVKDVDAIANAALNITPPGFTPATSPGVYVLSGETLSWKPVHPGLSDGELTALATGDLPQDARVIVDLTPEGRKAYDLVR